MYLRRYRPSMCAPPFRSLATGATKDFPIEEPDRAAVGQDVCRTGGNRPEVCESIANGYIFYEPESVIAARSQYQTTNSTIISFFAECMCRWPNGTISGSAITMGEIHKPIFSGARPITTATHAGKPNKKWGETIWDALDPGLQEACKAVMITKFIGKSNDCSPKLNTSCTKKEICKYEEKKQ